MLIYLSRKYGKGTGYYPSDIKEAAIVDQMLNFEAANIFLPGQHFLVNKVSN